MYPWSSWHTLVPLILGAAGIVGWLVWEYYVPDSPIVPLSIIGNRTAAAAFTGTLIMGIVQFGLLYYLPLYYQVSKGYSPLISGVALMPQILLSGPTTAITGALIAKTGRYRLIIWIGWALCALGCGLLVLLDANTTVVQWIFINAVSGLGMGALFASLSIATQAATADKHMAIASGLTPFFRAIGQGLGIVIGDAVFQNVFKQQLLAASSLDLRRNAAVYARDSASLPTIIRTMPAVEKSQLLAAFDHSLHAIWWTLTGFALAAGLLSLIIRQISLDRKRGAKAGASATDEEKAEQVEFAKGSEVTAAMSGVPVPEPIERVDSSQQEKAMDAPASPETSISDSLQQEIMEALEHKAVGTGSRDPLNV